MKISPQMLEAGRRFGFGALVGIAIVVFFGIFCPDHIGVFWSGVGVGFGIGAGIVVVGSLLNWIVKFGADQYTELP